MMRLMIDEAGTKEGIAAYLRSDKTGAEEIAVEMLHFVRFISLKH